jgi:hypothetical protein
MWQLLSMWQGVFDTTLCNNYSACGKMYLIQHYVTITQNVARCTWYNIMWQLLSTWQGVFDTTLCDNYSACGKVYLIQHYVTITWYNIMWQLFSMWQGVLNTTLCDNYLACGKVYLIQHYVIITQHVARCTWYNIMQVQIQWGVHPARDPSLKLEKNMIFWHKIVIFHTKYPKHYRASLHSVQFF